MLDIAHTEIKKYNSEWVLKYETEAEKIKNLIGDKIIEIEHIGSTSIPGVESKPIIDIAVLISRWENADDLIKKLSLMGYYFDVKAHEAMATTERHFLKKGNPTEFHLSITYKNKGSFWERQILFRDYLREHEDDKYKYSQIKQSLINIDPTGGDTYINGKTDYVMGILKKAGFENKYFDLSKY